ncbi:MAG: polymorphic toxin-type HINT domain-containing protein [Candidatus Peregrinibacteria bacterium]|nr:polymorphic toxin-type HINT domain-containing protein [Candidatus Peregrinibacteria bacterium]
MIPATALAMIAVITIMIINPGQIGPVSTELVSVAEAQDYYTMTPVESNETGVEANSSFKLTSEGDLDIEDIEKVISLTPAVELKFEQTSDNEIIITPIVELEDDTVYTFELAAQNIEDSPFKKEYTWAYEVSETFAISGTYPGDERTHIPVNSGIEVYFNFPGVDVEAFEEAFTIEPAISGSFEVNDKTAIFAPSILNSSTDNPMEEGTIYTVTIDANLVLDDTEQTLGEDYVFTFETSASTSSNTILDFLERTYEFSPADAPVLEVNYYDYNDSDNFDSEDFVTISTDIYRYKNGEDYFAAMQDAGNAEANWSYYTRSNYTIETDGLEKVVEFPELVLTEDEYDEWVVLPDALETGYYVIEIKKEDASAQAFLQISNTATYVSLSSDQSIVWVNDISTDEPVKGATVEFVDNDISTKTDSDGVASFEGLWQDLELKESEYNTKYIRIETDEMTTYYETKFYGYTNSYTSDYWQYLDTDRNVYLPTDKLYYWGFIQGREASVSGEAEMVLVSGYLGSWEAPSVLKDDNRLLDQYTFDLEDGEAFQGEFDLEKLSPGSYTLALIQDENILTLNTFYVEYYVKPAYQIRVEPEETLLFEGDITTVNIYAEFFEGTPVPNLDLQYRTSYSSPSQTLTTDENGHASFELTGETSTCYDNDYCSLTNYNYITVSPVNEELADIYGGATVITYRSKSYAEILSDSVTRDELSFDVHQLNLDLVDRDSTQMQATSDLYDGLSANTQVDLFIERVDIIKTESGEYYDPIDKVTRKKYTYTREEVTVADLSLYTDENGHFNYNPGLDDEHQYIVKLDIYDNEGNYYTTTQYVGSYYYSSWSTAQGLTFSTNKEGQDTTTFDIGEEVIVYAQSTQGDVLPSDGSAHYLFMESQDGINNYSVETAPEKSFDFEEEMIPNVYVNAVMFDGEYFWNYRDSESIEFNEESRRLEVEIETDSESYEPGDTVEITVQVTNEDTGKGTQADVILNLVDEAYYTLYSERFRDPLTYLYTNVSSNIYYRYASHEYEDEEEGGKGGCFVGDTQILMADGSTKNIEDIREGDIILTRANEFSDELVEAKVLRTYEETVSEYLLVNGDFGVTGEHILFINGQWQLAEDMKVGDILLNKDGEDVVITSIEKIHENIKVYNFEVEHYHTYMADGFYVHNDKGGTREEFVDTALFELVSTDSNGMATLTFELPDNITTWRITASAVSGDDIYAGYGNSAVEVTKDMFALPVINTEYLTGDKPLIPVRAYGVALSKGLTISFGMESETLDYEEEKEGIAYENTYFALPTLTMGQHTITTWTEYADIGDVIALTTNVEDSHLVMANSWDNLLSEGLKLEGSSDQRTAVYFINNEVGPIYSLLQIGMYQQEDRVDEALWGYLSKTWMNEYFDEDYTVSEFPTFTYQFSSYEESKGVALLPYAEADIKLSAQVAGLAPDLWEKRLLTNYFESIVDSADYTLTQKLYAIYGLASLNKSLLNELNYLVAHNELDVEEKIYAALTYTTYGADTEATQLFLEVLEEYGATEENGTLYITTKDATHDQELSWTALMATLAEQIDSSDRDTLWDYVLENDNYWDHEERNELIHLEKLLYMKNRLERAGDSEVSFEINGTKVTLENNEYYYRNLLPEELDALTFTKLDGEIRVFTFYAEPIALEAIETDSRVDISRTYYVDGQATTTFQTGDMVEVHISISAQSDLEGAYRVTDYLPSGLQTLSHRSYYQYDGNSSKYRNPYHVDQQQLNFYMYCSTKYQCNDKEFYYMARVINGGEFITEPAIIQKYDAPDIMNVSGERGTVTIETE